MIMLAMVLEAINIPVAYIGLIVAVDRLFDMGRTCLNVTGDIACSVCVTHWEAKKKAKDRQKVIQYSQKRRWALAHLLFCVQSSGRAASRAARTSGRLRPCSRAIRARSSYSHFSRRTP